jgi:hypothetical protein
VDERLIFRLSPDERKRLRPLVSMSALPWYYYAAVVGFSGAEVVVRLLAHGPEPSLILPLATVAAVSAGWLASTSGPWLAADGSLALNETGLTGTIDGKPAAIRWSDIASVRDVGSAVVVIPRGFRSAVAIPKAGIADLPRLWASSRTG